MGLPAKLSNTVLLVFLNGMKLSVNGEYETEGHFVRFTFRVKANDRLSFVTLSSDGPAEFEFEVPHTYEPWQWFNPVDPHDPAVRKVEPPAPTVTQL